MRAAIDARMQLNVRSALPTTVFIFADSRGIDKGGRAYANEFQFVRVRAPSSLIAFVCGVIPSSPAIKTVIDRKLSANVEREDCDRDNSHDEHNEGSF